MMPNVGSVANDIVFETIGRALASKQECRPLPVDLLESDEAFLAVFDAPGATATDVQVSYEGNRIRVTVERFRTLYDEYDVQVPGRGLTLTGEVSLPEDVPVDVDGASATLNDDGTLHVRVPKADES